MDEIAFKLQRSGRMGTYPQNKGQEAAAIGAAYAGIVGTDYLVPCYRENAALFMHGLPMEKVLLHWMGDERGNQIMRFSDQPAPMAEVEDADADDANDCQAYADETR